MKTKFLKHYYLVLFTVLIVLLSAIIVFMPDNQKAEAAPNNCVIFETTAWEQFVTSEIAYKYNDNPDTFELPLRIVIEPRQTSLISGEFMFYYDPTDPTTGRTLYMWYRNDLNGFGFDTYQQNTENLFYYRDGNTKYGDNELFSVFSYVEEIEGIEHIDFSNLASARGMFEEMSSLASLDLSNADFSNCLDMSYMFYNCLSLKALYLPTQVYGEHAPDKRGMFYGLESILELDLSYFYPHFEAGYDYSGQNDSSGHGEYNAFLKADYLQILKTPNASIVSSMGTQEIPNNVASLSIGEYRAITDTQSRYTLGSMLLAKTTFYKVGHIKYVIKINDTYFTLGTDTYLASVAYVSKTFALSQVNQIISDTGVQLKDEISGWTGILFDGTFSGSAGGELAYSTQNLALSNYISPVAYAESDPITLVYEFKDSNANPITPSEDTVVDVDVDTNTEEPTVPEDNPVIEELSEEEEGLSPGAKAGIATGAVAGAGFLTAFAGALATFRFTEIDGVTRIVFMIKKSAEECTVINFKGKRFKIKRKSLRRRKKKKDDDDDGDNDDRWFKKIPLFYIKWLK